MYKPAQARIPFSLYPDPSGPLYSLLHEPEPGAALSAKSSWNICYSYPENNAPSLHLTLEYAYSRLSNESTGTMKKTDPKIEAVRTFFAVLLAIIQEFEMLC